MSKENTMKKKDKQERSVYGKVSRAFMRLMTLRFARGNVRLIKGWYLDKSDVERMRRNVILHDFTHV